MVILQATSNCTQHLMPLTSISSIKMFVRTATAVKNRQRRNFSISLSQRETWWKSGNDTNLTLKLGHSWPLLQPHEKIPTALLNLSDFHSGVNFARICHFTHFSAAAAVFHDSYLIDPILGNVFKIPKYLYFCAKNYILYNSENGIAQLESRLIKPKT